jgi:SPX domain protein involved in polyphosphate accumulation
LTNFRFEYKFISYDTNYYSLLNWLKLHPLNFRKEYADRRVNNIYFDTKNFKAFNDNLAGLSDRFKTRFRWYGNFEQKKLGYLEFKIRKNVYGYKKSFLIKDLFINEKINPNMIKSIIKRSLDTKYKFIFENNSEIMLINCYNREYFKSFNNKIRITIDKNLKFFDQVHQQNRLNFSFETNTQKYLVLEIKFAQADKKFLNDINFNIPIKMNKNSKYINGMRAIMGIR